QGPHEARPSLSAHKEGKPMPMTGYVAYGRLQVADALAELVEREIAPGTGIDPVKFWAAHESILADLWPLNRAALAKRDELQRAIDAWHEERRGQPIDAEEYRAFLERIGYLAPEGPDFTVTTENVDPEIALVAGPQLVVPVTNARFALNAANARWGSLYDAL